MSEDQHEESGTDVLVRGGDLEVAPGLETHKVNAPVPPKASLQDPAITALLSANASEAQPLLPTFRRKRSRLYWIRKVAILLIVFSASLSVVVILFMHLPTIDHIAGDDEQIVLKVPTTLEELKVFRDIMDRYQVRQSAITTFLTGGECRGKLGLCCLISMEPEATSVIHVRADAVLYLASSQNLPFIPLRNLHRRNALQKAYHLCQT